MKEPRTKTIGATRVDGRVIAWSISVSLVLVAAIRGGWPGHSKAGEVGMENCGFIRLEHECLARRLWSPKILYSRGG